MAAPGRSLPKPVGGEPLVLSDDVGLFPSVGAVRGEVSADSILSMGGVRLFVRPFEELEELAEFCVDAPESVELFDSDEAGNALGLELTGPVDEGVLVEATGFDALEELPEEEVTDFEAIGGVLAIAFLHS